MQIGMIGLDRMKMNMSLRLLRERHKSVPAPVITASLFRRFRSRDDNAFSYRMLAALLNEFGGNAVKKKKAGA